MIDVPDRWLDRWRAAVQARAACWKLTCRDGTTYRFTSADQPVWIGSEQFLPRDDQGEQLEESGGGSFTGDRRAASLKEHAAGLRGIISSASISEADLRAGLYHNATVTVYMIDALHPSAGYMSRTYRVADVNYSTDGGWRFALVSAIDSAIQQTRGEIVSRTCRNSLFDAGCSRTRTPDGSDGLVADEWLCGVTTGDYLTVSQVDNAYTFRAAITAKAIDNINTGSAIPDATYISTSVNHYFCGDTAVDSRPIHPPVYIYGNVGGSPDINGTWDNVTTAGSGNSRSDFVVYGIDVTSAPSTLGNACLAPEANWFARGALTWRTGGNAGVIQFVRSNTAFTADPSSGIGGYATITLDAAPLTAIQVGDTLSISAGCDKRPSTCQSKFDNTVNFNGEPFTPSADILISSPNSR